MANIRTHMTDIKIAYITANCNNTGLGAKTNERIETLMAPASTIDAIVLNCQEVHFATLEKELKAKGLTPIKVAHRVTYTKSLKSTQLLTRAGEGISALHSMVWGDTGIATYVICKKGTTYKNVDTHPFVEVKNDKNSNKGGLISRFMLEKAGNPKPTTIDSISAHYDSKNPVYRAKNHLEVYQAHQKFMAHETFNDFKSLASALPSQLFFGADTNLREEQVREEQVEGSAPINLWADENNPEIQTYLKLPLVPTMHSADNTYGSDKSEIDTKRKTLYGASCMKGGRLDINGHFGKFQKDAPNIIDNISTDVDVIGLSAEEAKDHATLINTATIDVDLTDFKKVQQFICGRLKNIRPQLAESLSQLQGKDKEDEAHLLNIYNLYLALPDGLLHIHMENHQRFLEEIELSLKQEKVPAEREKLKKTHETIIKQRWAELEGGMHESKYKKMLNFHLFSTTTKRDYLNPNNLKGFEANKKDIDKISHNTITRRSIHRMKDSISDYSTLNPKLTRKKKKQLQEVINDSLNKASKKELYRGVQHYQDNHLNKINEYLNNKSKPVNTDNPKFFREALHDYINDRSLPYIEQSKRKFRLSDPNSNSTSMKAFLGKEGLALYQLALEEEANSTEYRDAVYFNSASLIEGPPWKERPIHYVVGVSACGKTYTAGKLWRHIKNILHFETDQTPEEKDKNLMLQPDGGTVREVSQIRKMMVELSNSQGYPGLTDLHKKSKVLETIKHNVREAAFASNKKVGVTIPETFSPWALKSLLVSTFWKTIDVLNVGKGTSNSIRKDKDILRRAAALDGGTAKIFCSEITGVEPIGFFARLESYLPIQISKLSTFRSVVEFMGTGRAFMKKGFDLFYNANKYGLNNTDIVESKVYGGSGFRFGKYGSRAAQSWMLGHLKNVTAMTVTNDLVLMKTVNTKSTYQYVRHGGEGVFKVSQQVIDAWEKREITRQPKSLTEAITQLNDKETESFKKTIQDYDVDDMAILYFKKDEGSATLEGFNTFLMKQGKSPDSKVTGTKDITLSIIKEKVALLAKNDTNLTGISNFINTLPVNYSINHLAELKTQIDLLSNSKLTNYYEELVKAERFSTMYSEYDLLYQHLCTITDQNPDDEKKVTEIKGFIENNELSEITPDSLKALITLNPESIFKLSIKKQMAFYTELTPEIQKAIQTIAFDEKRGHINIDLLRSIVIQTPESFFDIPYAYQRTVHNSLLQACSISSSEKRTQATAAIKKINEISIKALQDISKLTDIDEIQTTLKPQTGTEKEDHSKIKNQKKCIESLLDIINTDGTINQFHADEALLEIDKLLQKNITKNQKEIFNGLKDNITKEGFTSKTLNDFIKTHEDQLNPKSFSLNFFGSKKISKTYECIFSLYELLPGAIIITPADKAKITNTLPEITDEAKKRTAAVKNELTSVLKGNSASKNNFTTHMFQNMSKHLNVLQRSGASNNFSAEALYQQFLVEKSLAQAMTNTATGSNRFTVQGHVLINVHLTNADYENIYHRIYQEAFSTKTAFSTAKEALEVSLLGKLSDTTQCSVDIMGHGVLSGAFSKWMLTAKSSSPHKDTTSTEHHTLVRALEALKESPSRSSIITLEEEFEAHLNLLARVSKELIPDALFSPDSWEEIKKEAQLMLSEEIRGIVQETLVECYEPQEERLDHSKLNKKLDKARDLIGGNKKSYKESKVKYFLLSAMYKQDLKQSGKKDIKPKGPYNQAIKKIQEELEKGTESRFDEHNYSKTTATGLDSFRTDTRNQMAVRITATELTAHDKKLGADEQARRLFKRTHFQMQHGSPTISPLRSQNIELRVPSIAVVTEKNNDKAIQDVKEKLSSNYNYLSDALGGYQGSMTYNLLTSIDPNMDYIFRSNNYQTRSAELIIKGAHEFNKEQIKKGFENNLFYIQNIPVNQHGRALTLESHIYPSQGEETLKEVSLMSELSLLSTLQSHQRYLPEEQREKVNKCYRSVQHAYIRFLTNGEGKVFSQSKEGNLAIKALTDYKLDTKTEQKLISDDKTLQQLTVESLAIIHANNNLYQDLQFGMTIQALSVFLEPVSMAGCKSANERFAAVNGRVELLKSINNRVGENSLSHQELVIHVQMKMLIEASQTGNPKKLYSACKKLQEAIDTAYDKHGQQSSAHNASKEDQGFAGKVEKSSNEGFGYLGYNRHEMNTNTAESAYVKTLFQKHTGDLQAHKVKHKEAFINFIRLIDEKKEFNREDFSTNPQSKTDEILHNIAQLSLNPNVVPDKFNAEAFQKAFCSTFNITEEDFSWPAINALLFSQETYLEAKLILNQVASAGDVDFSSEEKKSALYDESIKESDDFKKKVAAQFNDIKQEMHDFKSDLLMRSVPHISGINQAERIMARQASSTPSLSSSDDEEQEQEQEQEEEEAMLTPLFSDLLSDENEKKISKIGIDAALNQKFMDKISTDLSPLLQRSTLFLMPKKAKQYQENLEALLSYLQKKAENIAFDIEQLEAITRHPQVQSQHDTVTEIQGNITLLTKNKEAIEDFTLKVKDKIDEFAKQAKASSSLNLPEIKVTYLTHQSIKEALPEHFSDDSNGMVSQQAVKKELEEIPAGCVALHQLVHTNTELKKVEPLAFTESQNHKELKALKFEDSTSRQAKMKLAFVMAQKYLMNLEGNPSTENKIYLRGNDPDFVEMLYGALHILSNEKAMNFPAEAIKILATGVTIKKDSSLPSTPSISHEIEKTLGKDYINTMIEISNEVKTSKTTANAEDKLKDLKEKIESYKNESPTREPLKKKDLAPPRNTSIPKKETLNRSLKGQNYTLSQNIEGHYVLIPKIHKGLVLSGGGAKGIAYVGMIEAMEARGDLSQITHIAGASAGAMTASLIAIGMNAKSISNLLINMNTKNLFGNYSRTNGERFAKALDLIYLCQIKAHITDIKNRSPDLTELKSLEEKVSAYDKALGNISINTLQDVIDLVNDKTRLQSLDKITLNKTALFTFSDLDDISSLLPPDKKHQIKSLSVVTTNTKTKTLETHNGTKTPNTSIAHAVLQSGAHPLLFQPQKNTKGESISDGGILDNMPNESLHDQGLKAQEILCVCIESGKDYKQRLGMATAHTLEQRKKNFRTKQQDALEKKLLGGTNSHATIEARNRKKIFYQLDNLLILNTGKVNTLSTKASDADKESAIENARCNTTTQLEQRKKTFDTLLIALLYLGEEELNQTLTSPNNAENMLEQAIKAKGIFLVQKQLSKELLEGNVHGVKDLLNEIKAIINDPLFNLTSEQKNKAFSLCVKQIDFLSEGRLNKEMEILERYGSKNEQSMASKILTILRLALDWILSVGQKKSPTLTRIGFFESPTMPSDGNEALAQGPTNKI